LFNRLQIRRKQNESPVALSIPSGYSRTTHELLTQLFFERFNVAGFMLVERPLVQLFAANAVTGVVVDVSYSDTIVTPIVDSMVQHNNGVRIAMGVRDCEVYLANILRGYQPLVATLSAGEAWTEEQLQEELLELVRQISRDNLVKVPTDGETVVPDEDEGVTNIAALLVAGKEKSVIEAGTKRKATAKQTQAEREREREIAALDLVQIEFKGKILTLGKERHRFCEPLLDPGLISTIPLLRKDPVFDNVVPLQEGVHVAVRSLSPERRFPVWGGVFVCGDIALGVKGHIFTYNA
jgi:actin-related protein 9